MAWHVTIYDVLVQGAVAGFVLLAIATVALLAIRQPARRIRVIEMMLVGLLALPFLALIPGYPRVAVLPAFNSAEVGDDENVNADALIVAKHKEKNPPAEPGAIAPVPEMPTVEPPALPGDSPESIPGAPPSGNLPAAPIASPQRGEIVNWHFPRDLRFWIVSGYFAGAGAMIAWSLVGWVAMARLLRSARPAGGACRAIFREIAGPKSDRVALLVSSRAEQPCALVWQRPTIVLPGNLAAGADERQLRFALAHEWSHLERGDVWTWGLSSVVRWFYFYQPLLWPLRRQLRLCQDFLADAAAARAGTAVEDYAEFLTSYSSRLKNPNLAHGLGIAGRASDLRRRIVMLVDNSRVLEPAVPRRWYLVALPIAVLVVAAVTSLGSRPAESAAEPPAAGGDDDPSAPPPDSSQRPASNVEDLFRPQPKGKTPATDSEAQPAAQRAGARQQTATANPPFATEPTPRPAAERRPVAIPSEAVIEMELEKDPIVQALTLRMAELTVQLAEAMSQPPDETDQGLIKVLQRQILQFGEIIDEHKARLRPKIRELLAAGQDPDEAPRRSRASPSVPPFSGRIRPGDLLKIDLAGGFPTGPPGPTTATVEPDGNVALGALYGGRVNVAGTTLSEAQEIIRKRLLMFLKDPQVQVTYEGHNPDIVPEGTEPPPTFEKQSEAKEPLQPLDTVEILMSLKPRVYRKIVNGKVGEEYSGHMPEFSGTYVIEPNGDIALPHGYGRVNVKGKDVRQAGAAIRDRLTEKMFTQTALPTVHVVKRGRAVFPDGGDPPADYRVRRGDSLLIGSPSHESYFNYKVDADGNIDEKRKISVEGMTLAEAQKAVTKAWAQPNFLDATKPAVEFAWFVTIGGWREEADPEVIDRLEGNDQTRVQRLERELQEVKDLIRQLNR